MASPGRIRAGLFDVLNAVPRLNVYQRLTESIELGDGGAAVVGPMAFEPNAMGRGSFAYEGLIYVIAPAADYGIATDILDELIAPAGERSLWQAVWNTRNLGILEPDGTYGTDCTPVSVSNYGGTLADAMGVDHIAAQLNLAIYSPGTT